jgi:hypothetical protein
VLVAVVFAIVAVLGTVQASSPSDAVIESGRQPTTTTTTEPPPAGVAFVIISNGVFSPSTLKLDITEIQTVRWTNEDKFEYLLTSASDAWEPITLLEGDSFEFDFSTLEPAIHRYNATLGFNRVPGSVDTRPDQ